MTFRNEKEHSKYKDIGISFKNSEISQINKGMCGFDKNKKKINLTGTYILNLVDTLNKILDVKISELMDDSRIELCDSNVSLKIINLLKYGKTWYERVGYTLNDKEIYKRNKEVGELRLSELYTTLIDIDDDVFKKEFMDFKLDLKKIQRVETLLQKINMSKNVKIKNVIPEIFKKDTPFNECEQKFLWDSILNLQNRTYIRNTTDPKYKLIKEYYKYQRDIYTFSESTKVYT